MKTLKVLIVKTSSMGDVIHTLPALEDAYKNCKNIQFDWAVEPEFAEIPSFHRGVNKVIPIPLRKWRKNIFKYFLNGEIRETLKNLRTTQYDKIIDTQGLLKSLLITKLAKGVDFGFDFSSIREPLAAIFYKNRFAIKKDLHAITRNRMLFARSLGYEFDEHNEQKASTIEYGLDLKKITNIQDPLISNLKEPYVVLLHGTTWETKQWPTAYWIELANMLAKQNLNIYVTAATKAQLDFVVNLKNACGDVINILPKMNIIQAAKLLANANSVVGVDTGFCHLAAALNKKTISLFGATDPNKSAPRGNNQIVLKSNYHCSPCLKKQCKFKQDNTLISQPCFLELTPDMVLQKLSLVAF